MSFYRKSFQPEKFSLDICKLLSNKSHCAWSSFIKHNSLKSDIFFNPTHIYSIFFRIHVFQDSDLHASRFFRVQISKGSSPRFRVQVLEAALWIYIEITLRHRCSHFAVYLRTSFYKNTFKGLLLFFLSFIIHQYHQIYCMWEELNFLY